MANDKQRRTIHSLLETLSDAHFVLTQEGADLNAAILKVDDNQTVMSPIHLRRAECRLATLIDLLKVHAARCERIADELETIRISL
jgi:hypothetical protein